MGFFHPFPGGLLNHPAAYDRLSRVSGLGEPWSTVNELVTGNRLIPGQPHKWILQCWKPPEFTSPEFSRHKLWKANSQPLLAADSKSHGAFPRLDKRLPPIVKIEYKGPATQCCRTTLRQNFL